MKTAEIPYDEMYVAYLKDRMKGQEFMLGTTKDSDMIKIIHRFNILIYLLMSSSMIYATIYNKPLYMWLALGLLLVAYSLTGVI